MVKTGRNSRTLGRKKARSPGLGSLAIYQKWGLRRLGMKWKRARERQVMVGSFEEENGNWGRGKWNVGTVLGEPEFFLLGSACWKPAKAWS